ncbi:MAG TPA: helix-turn-helix domain-containing protein [Blastocatellia bacterium]|nr:helix-turn-helix domain-containing protein [Blastocatellia bacterium]
MSRQKRGDRSGGGTQRPYREGFRLASDPLPSWRDAKIRLERWLLSEALVATSGNMAAASRLLGITKVAVLHAVRRHHLESLARHRAA